MEITFSLIMKRANHLLEGIIDPENLRIAFWKASKGKRHAAEVLAYQHKLDQNLSRLRDQIISGKVIVGDYRFFKIYEPKERQICASAFSEQVLHHGLMNICHPYFERVQIYDSYASRKEKGTYAALKRAQKFTHTHKWYLKLDVKKFFASVHHEVIKSQLERMFKEGHLLGVFEKIIDSFEELPQRGVPIGNLTSQYFANNYLAGLDHFIKEQLRIKAYVRYMDDMILWHDEKGKLEEALHAIEQYININLKCDLKPISLNQTKLGLSFLGYRIFPFYTQLTQQSKQRFIKKMRILEHNYETGFWNEANCQRRALSLLAFVKHADTQPFLKILKYGQSS